MQKAYKIFRIKTKSKTLCFKFANSTVQVRGSVEIKTIDRNAQERYSKRLMPLCFLNTHPLITSRSVSKTRLTFLQPSRSSIQSSLDANIILLSVQAGRINRIQPQPKQPQPRTRERARERDKDRIRREIEIETDFVVEKPNIKARENNSHRDFRRLVS